MKKYIKQHIKEEKQIVRLLYRKGFIKPKELKTLGWDYCTQGKRGRKRKGKRNYSYSDYLPEVHYYWFDSYAGYGDSRSVIDYIIEKLWWDNHNNDCDFGETGNSTYGTSSFKYNGREWFIKYLKSLPTVRCDSKINKYLIITKE